MPIANIEPIKMKFSVIIPVINCLELTKAAVMSMRSKWNHSLVIVDNGSTDGTEQWATTEMNRMRNLETEPNKGLLRMKYQKNADNIGVAAAWNQGIKVAREIDPETQYFLVANNDILFHPETLDRLVEALDTHPEWGMATGVNDKGWADSQGGPHMIFTKVINDAEVSDSEHPDFSCFMIRGTSYDQVGEFDEEFSRRGKAYFEDNDYHYRMHKMGVPARCTTAAPYYHYASQTRQHNPNLVSDTAFHSNRAYFIEKHGMAPEQTGL